MSSVPAVIDAIVADAAAALPGIQVIDAKFEAQAQQDDYVIIGWSPSRAPTVATTTLATLDNAETESYDIPCSARSWSGDKGVKARRDAAFALFESVAAAVLESTALAALAASAVATFSQYTPVSADNGTTVTVDFRIHIEALL